MIDPDERTLEELKTAFSESDLKIAVDVLHWHAVSPEFQRVIDREYEIIQRGRRRP